MNENTKMDKLKITILSGIAVTFLSLIISSPAMSFAFFLSETTTIPDATIEVSEVAIPNATNEVPKVVYHNDIYYLEHQVNISDLNRKQKAELLAGLAAESSEDIYVEHEGEMLKVLDEVESRRHFLFWIRYYVKTQNPDDSTMWYNIDNWDGTYYHLIDEPDELSPATWPNLKDEPIEWYNIDGKYYGMAHDKSPPSFSDRELPTPIKVSDLPEAYKHYCRQWVTKSGPEFDLTDRKLELIWEEARRIDLDPFYFLAILAAEGTGSFNTKQVSGYEGGQPESRFEIDVRKAANLIQRELEDWRNAGKPGDWLQWVNIGNADHINPHTDRFINVPKYEDYAGGYAKDHRWWENVRMIYNGFRLESP